MSNVKDIKCPHCEKLNTRKYQWFNPDTFRKPELAFVTSSFYCAFCGKGIALKLSYLPDGKMEIIEEVDFKALIKDVSAPFYIGGPSGDDDDKSPEILTEDAAFSLLNEAGDD